MSNSQGERFFPTVGVIDDNWSDEALDQAQNFLLNARGLLQQVNDTELGHRTVSLAVTAIEDAISWISAVPPRSSEYTAKERHGQILVHSRGRGVSTIR